MMVTDSMPLIVGSQKSPSNEAPTPISKALDGVPLGRFHILHLARMLVAWSVFSMSQEATPYLFPGFRRSFLVDSAGLAHIASAFPLGCAVGAALASVMVDMAGRRAIMVVAAPIASALHLCMVLANSFKLLVMLRFLQAVAWAMAMTATVTWYAEFLPTRQRGPLLASYSIGWPLGRAAVIGVAAVSGDSWRWLLALGAMGFATLAILAFWAPESPRFLLSCGNEEAARRVLQQMHATNGSQDHRNCNKRLCLADDGGNALPRARTSERFKCLMQLHFKLLAFSLTLFGILSVTTVLIDTWGPIVFQNFVSPSKHELPHRILQCFNMGDLLGIIMSIFLADKIGRRGNFAIGFFVQAMLFATVAVIGHSHLTARVQLVVAFGTAASACRCFAWESAHFWTLEAFTTDLRGMAFGIATGAMRLFSVVSLEVSGWFIGSIKPETALGLFAVFLGTGGVVTLLLMPMETANKPISESRGAHVEHSCKA